MKKKEKIKEISVAIATPHTGTIKSETVACIVKMIRELSSSSIPNALLMREGSVLHWNREELVKQAMKIGASHILFVDDDMVFEKEAVMQLLQRNKDIVGVHYNCRKFPATTTVHMNETQKKNPELLAKCDAVGTGFTLIKLEVFKKLKHPWFFWKSNEEGEVEEGEDYWFCRIAREAGFEVWVDLTIKVGHIGEYTY